MKLLLAPGNLVCDLAGLPQDSDHRQILRLYTNTLVWSLVAVAATLVFTL